MYFQNELTTVYLGDCREVLPALGDFDAVCCDPPYGLSFMGRAWDHGVPGTEFWEAILGACKPGAHLLAFGGTRTFHRLTCAIEDAGWEIRDCLMWLYGQGFPKSLDVSKAIDKAAGAKQWSGYGTALKPAWEPIILARKPLDGTVAANVLKFGCGAINIDASRIDYQSDADKDSATPQGACTAKSGALAGATQHDGLRSNFDRPEQLGRFPANLILDEEAAEALDEQSGERKSSGKLGWNQKSRASALSGDDRVGAAAGMFASRDGEPSATVRYTDEGGTSFAMLPGERRFDSGGASRFFYCAKASKSDRGPGNTHPTVKPRKLMEYLLKLVVPQGGKVLDPFAGSGTTLVAAESLGVQSVGIELEPAHCEIIAKRLTPLEAALAA